MRLTTGKSPLPTRPLPVTVALVLLLLLLLGGCVQL
jgi:hypothetical protein